MCIKIRLKCVVKNEIPKQHKNCEKKLSITNKTEGVRIFLIFNSAPV